MRLAIVAALLISAPAAHSYSIGENHQFDVTLQLDLVSASSDLAAWPDGGLGKLRYDDSDSIELSRLTIEYQGRIKPTLWANVIADYIDDGAGNFDIAEAFVTWRPIPKSASRHQVRAGAMYPPFSYENTARAWTSPYSISFSAINTWLGEEIRPFGVEWSMTRRVGSQTSAHQIKLFASAFWGNDPAGTLLFWRGWSVHDRQTRIGERLMIPPIAVQSPGGDFLLSQTVAPAVETDSEPGFYGGLEWRFANRIRAQIGAYDNRADPWSFSRQQWGWNTRFWNASLQAELPARFGLIAQRMSGDTIWIPGALQDGTVTGDGNLVADHFDSAFVLLTRQIGAKHRASLRIESFSIHRPGSAMLASPDDGDALTVAYIFSPDRRFSAAFEWLQIDSRRDLWTLAYALPREARERLFRIQFAFHPGA